MNAIRRGATLQIENLGVYEIDFGADQQVVHNPTPCLPGTGMGSYFLLGVKNERNFAKNGAKEGKSSVHRGGPFKARINRGNRYQGGKIVHILHEAHFLISTNKQVWGSRSKCLYFISNLNADCDVTQGGGWSVVN